MATAAGTRKLRTCAPAHLDSGRFTAVSADSWRHLQTCTILIQTQLASVAARAKIHVAQGPALDLDD